MTNLCIISEEGELEVTGDHTIGIIIWCTQCTLYGEVLLAMRRLPSLHAKSACIPLWMLSEMSYYCAESTTTSCENPFM